MTERHANWRFFIWCGWRDPSRVCRGALYWFLPFWQGFGCRSVLQEGKGRERKTGVIPIETEKRIDWNAIKSEYIGGGISQRKLAEKYGLMYHVVRNKAEVENWVELREKAERKSNARITQKVAEAAADNATIAENIKKTMLLRLQRIAENYPKDATEVRRKEDGAYCLYRIKDLAEAYKALTEDIPKPEENRNAPIYELLRKLDGECDVQ